MRICGEPTIIAGTQTRGPMCTVGLVVSLAPAFRHVGSSAIPRRAPRLMTPTQASGFEKNDEDAGETLRFAIRLQQERRPPQSGCWLITEILDARYAFAGDMGNDLQ